MNVLALTIFVSASLAAMFALLWIAQACTPQAFSIRDALLPLEDDHDVAAAPSPGEAPPATAAPTTLSQP